MLFYFFAVRYLLFCTIQNFLVSRFYFCEKFNPDPVPCEIDLRGVLTTFYKVIRVLVSSKTCMKKFCTLRVSPKNIIGTSYGSEPITQEKGELIRENGYYLCVDFYMLVQYSLVYFYGFMFVLVFQSYFKRK